MLEKYALYKIVLAFRNTTKAESVRSIAKAAHVGTATAKQWCDYLFEGDIIKREIIGRMYQYQINSENMLARQIKIALSVSEVLPVVEELKTYPEIMTILLYGSSASGKDTATSDIDLLIITAKPIKIRSLHTERKLSREISVSSYTHMEWKKKTLSNRAFYESIIYDSIPLYGERPVV
ncbi:MAG TPA: nucleotidyltransferase domain-containing protein [Candidatus Nanoarchaeia archaeon]|nr:nucleotidyltransferase domain-containing protein [Candidatus Nanoarchaeia archaeon]